MNGFRDAQGVSGSVEEFQWHLGAWCCKLKDIANVLAYVS